MTKKLQHIFALSEKGARDLVKAVIWCFVCNLALMFPVGAVLFTVQHLLGCLESSGSPMDGFWLYVGFALAVLLLLFVLHWFQYASLYIATYQESANRRVSLAETLRRLPLSFFGNRDLSDLTSTMIADCSSLDQMFSHYVPQLFASVGSTLVIGVCMFACDWRMALAVLWVVPVAVALTAGSKKIQDAFGTKNILNKRAVADCIQEGLETIRDIKACHRQERYLDGLEAKLAAMEGSSIRSELATGVFVCSAQAFLRLGLATTVLTGGALLLALAAGTGRWQPLPAEGAFYITLAIMVFIAVATMVTWFSLLSRPEVKVSELNMWKFLIPVFGSLEGWLLVEGDTPNAFSVTGMILLTASLLLFYHRPLGEFFFRKGNTSKQ